MKSKLTLTIEKKVGKSKEKDDALHPDVKALKGTFKMPKGFDYKRELRERRANKP